MGWVLAALAACLFAAVCLAVIGVIVYSFVQRRHGESDRPQPGWIATDEVFSDPSTRRRMRVWLDADGGRHYVPEAPAKRGGDQGER